MHAASSSLCSISSSARSETGIGASSSGGSSSTTTCGRGAVGACGEGAGAADDVPHAARRVARTSVEARFTEGASPLAHSLSRVIATQPATCSRVTLERIPFTDLTIDDAESFRHVALYSALEAMLRKAKPFVLVSPAGKAASWDRALFLNLTFWGASDTADVLVDDHIPADVVCHIAWHHLAREAFAKPASADALFMGEAIASAFDIYLVGRLLENVPDAEFIESQVPAMFERASAAGMSEKAFEALMQDVTKDPERAFEDLRSLLFDVTTTLLHARTPIEASSLLDGFSSHRFAPLLHHYEISNWILYTRAYASTALAPDPAVREVDKQLRESKDALAWLEHAWLSSLPKR